MVGARTIARNAKLKDKKMSTGSTDDALDFLRWFLGGIILVIILWFVLGGPERFEKEGLKDAFMKGPTVVSPADKPNTENDASN